MPGFLALLALMLIGFKLAHVIAWSWWLVLLPIYGPTALWIALAVIAATGIGVGAGLLAIFTPKRSIAQVGKLRPLSRY